MARTRCCLNCGNEFQPQRVTAEFCGDTCRKAFNNRRMTRGAEIYDMFMALRYERGMAKAMKLWGLMCRMAQEFREEDERVRAGRKSWGDPKAVLERRPYLLAVVSYTRAGR